MNKILPKSILDANFAEVLETKVSVANLFKEVEIFAKFYQTQITYRLIAPNLGVFANF